MDIKYEIEHVFKIEFFKIKSIDFKNKKKQIDHLHQDLSKLERKTDTVIYWIIGGAFTTILTLVGLFNLFIS